MQYHDNILIPDGAKTARRFRRFRCVAPLRNCRRSEKQMHEKLKSKNPTAEDQVRVKPMDEFGNAKRAGGNYLDDLFINKDGKMEIIEY